MTYVRQEFDQKTKMARWLHAKGRCEYCDIKLVNKPVEYDHFKSCRDDGDNSFENCRVSCTPCHRFKTDGEDYQKHVTIRKREKREAGIKPKSKWQTSKSGPYKQKIGGQIVRR